jgi:putative peptidoglycan lipid II flippase
VDADAAREQMRRLLRPLLFVTVPGSVFLVLHAQPVVRLIFGRGEFGEDSVAVTSLVLLGLAAGFWAQVTAFVLAKAMSAQGRNTSVARITAIASLAHVAVNVLLYRTLGALALGIAASTQALVLLLLAARTLRVGRDVSLVMLPLVLGAAGYLALERALDAAAALPLIASAAVFVAYWALFVLGLHALARRLPGSSWIRPVFLRRSGET